MPNWQFASKVRKMKRILNLVVLLFLLLAASCNRQSIKQSDDKRYRDDFLEAQIQLMAAASNAHTASWEYGRNSMHSEPLVGVADLQKAHGAIVQAMDRIKQPPETYAQA